MLKQSNNEFINLYNREKQRLYTQVKSRDYIYKKTEI